tara:strand:- start:723 stop:1118 length:396 start_codon:yes stop_codon:yes gene_type:complete
MLKRKQGLAILKRKALLLLKLMLICKPVSLRRRKRMPLKKGSMKGHSISGGQKRPTKSGAGMTKKGVAKYRRDNPGSKLKTAVTGSVKKGSKDSKRRKSYCARSAGQMKKFPKAAKNPNSRLRQARKRWKC